MKDITVLFDIDYTLFNTDSFKKSGLTLYTLYPQVKKVLELLNTKYTLGILSEGEMELQMNKLKQTGIVNLFNQKSTFIVKDKHGELEQIMKLLEAEKAVFVEDKKEMLARAKELDKNLITVWVKNGPYAQSTQSTFIPDYQINTLIELPNLLEDALPSVESAS